jgi:hypothetical protein
MNTDIKKHNLAQFAQEFYGFVSTNKSTKNNPVLENGSDKIVIKRQSDGNYTFWSPTEDNCKGSVIDFVMWREKVDLKEAATIALKKITGHIQDVQTGKKAAAQDIINTNFDREKVKDFKPAQWNKYLESRSIDNLEHGRFRGTVMFDPQWHNAIFPHKNEQGQIVGYAIKNDKFNGFSPGGQKTIWRSNQFDQDHTLVITESGVDALSYGKLMQLRNPEKLYHTRFISVEGGFRPEIQDVIKKEIESMPPDATIIGAFDNDKQGRKYVETIKQICQLSNRKFESDLPRIKNYDWNDVLKKFLERQNYQSLDQEMTEVTEPSTTQEKATGKQLKVLSDFVRSGVIEPIDKEEWKNLSMIRADEIICDAEKKKQQVNEEDLQCPIK